MGDEAVAPKLNTGAAGFFSERGTAKESSEDFFSPDKLDPEDFTEIGAEKMGGLSVTLVASLSAEASLSLFGFSLSALSSLIISLFPETSVS